MRIVKVIVSHYRCLEDLEIEVGDYMALIGPNGSGKSTLLYALDWFFNGGDLTLDDWHHTGYGAEVPDEGTAKTISVTVILDSLNTQDRAKLGKYGRGTTARFRRTWAAEDNSQKVIGHATQGPDFATLRQMTRIGEMRTEYARLCGLHPTLDQTVTSKEDILRTLDDWESHPDNTATLEAVDDADATHLFGINGTNVIQSRVRLVLVPAAADIANEIGKPTKGSALDNLIGSLMSKAGSEARAEWEVKYATQIAELNHAVKAGIEQSTGLQADRVNQRFSQLVPGAEIHFNPQVPAWSPKASPTIQTDVLIDGTSNDVSRQGHGVQRAVMIAMLQAWVPDSASASNQHRAEEGETDEDSRARLQESLDAIPSLVICIEEPEIYQHPVRARNFGKVLTKLSEQQDVQVFIATHSPYFLRPEQFQALRRFQLTNGRTSIKATTIAEVASRASCAEDKISKTVEKQIPTTFSEGFFSDAVVIVEGDTDKAVLEVIAERLGQPLDANGISILPLGGKDGLRAPFAILSELDIPVYVVVDGDDDGATASHASHKSATEAVVAWLPNATSRVGTHPYSFEAPTTVTDKYTFFHNDLEEELEKWPSFMAALASNGGSIDKKDSSAYRAAAMEADVSDLPDSLRNCAEAISNFT